MRSASSLLILIEPITLRFQDASHLFLTMEGENALCQFCKESVFKYVCPRCNIPYCSVGCYQSPAHLDCSEAFYKENVQDWVKSESQDPESKKKMMEILQRVNQEEDDIDLGDDSDDEESLTDRLGQVDLDDADEVWDRLLPEEKQEFLDLIKNGDVCTLIPEWEPWWDKKYPTPKVRFLDEPYEPEYKSTSPRLTSVSAISTLTKAEPSPQIYFNVVNVIASYVVTCRYLNGDTSELAVEGATTLIQISKNLSSNEIFSDFDLAVESVNQSVIDCPWITLDPDANRSLSIKTDVTKILEGPNEEDRLYYARAALSDAITLVKSAKATKKNQSKGKFSMSFPEPSSDALPPCSKDTLNKCAKKLEFYLSWTDAYLPKFCQV